MSYRLELRPICNRIWIVVVGAQICTNPLLQADRAPLKAAKLPGAPFGSLMKAVRQLTSYTGAEKWLERSHEAKPDQGVLVARF